MSSHTVAIVGRPNVGKSTLFNRLAGRRLAVVHEDPGVTRDRLVTLLERDGRRIYLVDTGGISLGGEELSEKTTQSALEAVEEASLILFLVDVRTGVTEEDLAVARILRRHSERVWVIVNKVERKDDEIAFHEFHSLGLGEPLPISALNGEGTLDLWDRLAERFPPIQLFDYDPEQLHLALVGRPNVGKSSIVNALLGEERMIVSDMPGTTRDSVDATMKWHGHEVVLVDTAGLRRKAKVRGRLEVYSNLRSLSAIDRAEVIVLILDGDRTVADQDLKIASHAHAAGRGLVICVNKWDLVKKEADTMGKFVKNLREQMDFVDYAPIIFISALTKQRIHKVIEVAWDVFEQRRTRVSTSQVNKVLEAIVQYKPPHYYKHGTGKIYYGTQVSARPPTFQIFVNKPDLFPEHYRRFLANQLRKAFPFPGSRIRLRLKPRKESDR